MQAALAAQKRGRLDQAIDGYRRVLRFAPRLPEAHNNLGAALRQAGRPEEAAESYRRAVALRPRYGAAHANLAATLLQLGRRRDALGHALEALRLDPESPRHRQILAEALRTMRFTAASPPVAAAVESCFGFEGIEHQLLVPAALSLLRVDAAVRRALEPAGTERDDNRPDGLPGLFANTLLQAVMTRALVADPAFERLLTGLRRRCLQAAVSPAAPPGLVHEDPGFAAALACQCFLTDYAFAETAEETDLVARLADGLAGVRTLTPAVLALAMYRPLHDLAGAAGLAAQADALPAPLARVVRLQLREPLEERGIEGALPALTALEGTVTAAVRRQYEDNPYPRWQSTGRKEARPLGEVVAGLFPHLGPMPATDRPTRILVAGCGTGKHAADAAARYRGARVLAVDLSRRSLAYARRKAEAAGLSNLRFAQADILALGTLDERFDLIEAVGVLHHLAEPLAGWRQLLRLLEPGGLMKLGLYSTRGRRTIAAARDHLRRGGFAPDGAGLRAARQAILALDPDHPARGVAGELDFYSLSGCRDLLFNVQERSYDLPEVAAALAGLGLAFLGFEFVDDEVPRRFAERFPAPGDPADLAHWDAFEADNPETFRNMYQFWCRKGVA